VPRSRCDGRPRNEKIPPSHRHERQNGNRTGDEPQPLDGDLMMRDGSRKLGDFASLLNVASPTPTHLAKLVVCA
jgi:hypothetical protein